MGKYSIIKGTGSYIPPNVVPNEAFLDNQFYDDKGVLLSTSIEVNKEIIQKFKEKVGIEKRRYISDDMVTSDEGYLAAKNAYDSCGANPKETDVFVFADNFFDVKTPKDKVDMVPAHAARIKPIKAESKDLLERIKKTRISRV